MTQSLYRTTHRVDVCVVGGGMAGLCAAIAAARNGARTLLVHDRSVLGGNASSEIRMWICGAHGPHNKETGVLEEIQLANLRRNAGLNYSIWDSVLYEKAHFQPNLTTLFDASVFDARMEDGHIAAVTAWQSPTQTMHVIEARHYIDCSGDSILAPLTGAACRRGREARSEFNEDIEPETADAKTMGNSLLIQLHLVDHAVPFTAPNWAYKFDTPEDLPFRMNGVRGTNFWWIELGGLQDTIRDSQHIRDELMKVVYGVWDYIKNRAPEREQAACWDVHWFGAHPGKRESRRYEGDHILTQNDIEAGGPFDDVVAYGGWSMDDHHPAGLLFPGKPTIFHPAPNCYRIPYRCLYSRNVPNLLFAGRNISVTHAALSSTRVMGTCSILGQAAGTAAALAHRHGCPPREVHASHLRELQQTLMNDDCFLPGVARRIDPLTLDAKLSAAGEGASRLLDGCERDRENEPHAWAGGVGDAIELAWENAVDLGSLRVVFDSDLSVNKRLPCAYPVSANRNAMPNALVRAFHVDVKDASGQWTTVHREADNVRRLVELPMRQHAGAVRVVVDQLWNDPSQATPAARVFSVEASARCEIKLPDTPEGPRFAAVRDACDPADLAPPAKDDAAGKSSARGA